MEETSIYLVFTGGTMNNQTQIAAVDSPKRQVRGRFRWLGGAVVLVLGLILVGTIYESVSEAADIQAYPPPGEMVDVGGYRLHINCTGEGSPTVVIESGWGDSFRVGVGCSPSRQDHAYLHLRSGRDGVERVQSPAANCPGICERAAYPAGKSE